MMDRNTIKKGKLIPLPCKNNKIKEYEEKLQISY